jgi:DNA-binding GntR family transcriptional regulator
MPPTGSTADVPSLGGQNVAVIHDRLRAAILRGDLAAGDELSQVRLARELGVSRTPLREALRMLISEGLVEGLPNRQLRVSGFSIEDMESLYAERILLEALAIRITVPRLSARDIGAMEGLLAQMAHHAAERDYDSWALPHQALHEAFVAEAGRRTAQVLRQLSEHAQRYRRAYTTQVDLAWSTGIADHRVIVDACKRRDAAAAARVLAEHLGHTALGVIELVEPGHDAFALRTAVAVAGQEVLA